MEFKSQDAQNIYKSNRLFKVLRVISMIIGIVACVLFFFRFLQMLVFQEYPFQKIDAISLMYNSYYFSVVPGLFLLIGVSKSRRNQVKKAMRLFQLGSISLIILIIVPLISIYLSMKNINGFGLYDLIFHLAEIFQLLIYPIFFFIVKKRLSRMNHS